MDKWLNLLRSVPQSITTGYALMALAIIIIGGLIFTLGLSENQKFILLGGILVAALASVFLLRGSSKTDHGQRPAQTAIHSVLNATVKQYVDSSELPAYITDENLIVRHFNNKLLSFIGAQKSHIIDKHVKRIIEHFVELVPEDRRESFLERQAKAVEEAERAPYAAVSEVVDLSQRAAGLERRKFRVWIHADIIQSLDDEKPAGWLVTYHPVEIADDPSGKVVLVDE